jgi:hypothetical protein
MDSITLRQPYVDHLYVLRKQGGRGLIQLEAAFYIRNCDTDGIYTEQGRSTNTNC